MSFAATHRAPAAPSPAADLYFPRYEPQKVVYQILQDGGFLNREYRRVLAIMENHVEAVGADWLDLRVVLQGDGVGLLAAARTDASLRKLVDDLRGKGVRFLVCRNTLVSQRIDPADLYKVETKDIVAAGLPELAALAKDGFVYLRP